jgi:hypothetical protein
LIGAVGVGDAKWTVRLRIPVVHLIYNPLNKISLVRMAEWSKAPDSSSGPLTRAWVQIPLLTLVIIFIILLFVLFFVLLHV